jgi:hypothetical protein
MSDMLWTEASRDLEEEAAEYALHQARSATAGLWPFFAMARTAGELEQRLVIAGDSLREAALSHGCDLGELADSVRRQHTLVLEAASHRADPYPEEAQDPVDHEGHDIGHHADAEGLLPEEAARLRRQRMDGYDSSMAFGSLRTALQEGLDPLSWVGDAVLPGAAGVPAEHRSEPDMTGSYSEVPAGPSEGPSPKA